MAGPRTQKPKLYLLNQVECLSPEKLATLFTKLTGIPTTSEEMNAAMEGAESRAAEYQKQLRPGELTLRH